MTSVMQNRLTLGIAIAAPCAVAFWILTTRSGAIPSTYMFVIVLAIAVGIVGFNTWRNGQATGSMAQVIHEADISGAVPVATEPATPGRRAWEARRDADANASRVRGLLALSAAVTGVLLFYVWLT